MARHIILLKEVTAIKDYHFHEGVYLVNNNVQLGGTCQSNIPKTGKTQGLLAEHFSKHHFSSASRPSFHSAFQCNLFLRLATRIHLPIHIMYLRKHDLLDQATSLHYSGYFLWSSSDAYAPIVGTFGCRHGSAWAPSQPHMQETAMHCVLNTFL